MKRKTISYWEIVNKREKTKNIGLQDYINLYKNKWYKILKDKWIIKKYAIQIEEDITEEELRRIIKEYKKTKDPVLFEKILWSLILLIISEAGKILQWNEYKEDLISAWIISIVKAIEMFDFNKNIAFSSYAMRRIRSYMYKELYILINPIDVPWWLRKTIKNLEKKIIDYDLDDEILKTNITKKTYVGLVNSIHVKSIDFVISKEEDKDKVYLSDLLQDTTDVTADAEIKYRKKILKEYIYWTLNENERYIIIHRFGLFNTERMTLDEIWKALNLTWERVRQIEEKVLKKIKHYFISLNINDWW